VAVSLALLVVVAVSQLALAHHYPSDVIAGWLLAGAWVAVVLAGRGAAARLDAARDRTHSGH
jgi:undecaprenyl-diphosphatase